MAGRQVTSLKNETIDFDLLEIKQKFSDTPKTNNVRERERFIDRKKRRGSASRKVDEIMGEQAQNQKYADDIIKANREQALLRVKDNPSEEIIIPETVSALPDTPQFIQPDVEQEPVRLGRKVNK